MPLSVLESSIAEDVHSVFAGTPDNPPRSAVVLWVYLDESGQQNQDTHAVVAGFLGTEAQFSAVAYDWIMALYPKESLHMGDLRWNDDKAERRVRDLLAKLGPLPHKHGLSPIFGAVRYGDYVDMVAGIPEMESKVKGYAVCFSTVLAKLMEIEQPESVKIVCERQDRYESHARHLMSVYEWLALEDGLPVHFHSIEFVSKGVTVLTQPSDYLAFAIAKQISEPDSTRALWTQPILNGKTIDGLPGKCLERERVRDLMRQVMERKAAPA